VEAALKHPRAADMSNVEIANHCGVTHQTVANHRNGIIQNLKDAPKERTVTRKGKTYTQKTANIGKSKKKKPA